MCGDAMGQRPGRTQNMLVMLVTCATSQSRGWLKLEAYCQVRREGREECSGARGVPRGGRLQARREACVRGGALGQRLVRTKNMRDICWTRATSQSSGWLKLEACCQVRRGGGEERSAVFVGCTEAAGCRQGGRLACDGAIGQRARAYIEHPVHAGDLRDVPLQGLVEAGGALPGAERGRR